MNNLLECKQCNNTGKTGLYKCKSCSGRGIGIFAGDYFLYWGGVKSLQGVRARKMKRIVNKIIDGFLILFGIYGFLNLVKLLWSPFGFTKLLKASFWLTPDIHLLIFFLALWGFIYFVARATREAHKYEKAIQLGFGEALEMLETLTWEDIKQYKQIDVSKSLSLQAEKAIEDAFELAKNNQKSIEAEELTLSLFRSPKVKIIFGRLGIPIKQVAEKIKRNIAPSQKKPARNAIASVAGGRINLSAEVLQILLNSYIESAHRKSHKVEVNIILLEIAKVNEFFGEVLYDLNVDENKLLNVVKWIEIQDKLRQRWMEFRKASVLRPRGEINRAMTSARTPILDMYSEDITMYAKRGAIDFCIGRKDVVRKIFRIIEGGSMGVVLVGERGVGKSAIIDGIAELMIKEDVPEPFQDKRLVRLSLSEILGGATSEEAGEKLMSAISGARFSGNIVLDIPNLEYFASSGQISIAALLADELKKSNMPVVASTTPEGYRKIVEGTALAGIFEKVEVAEPDMNLAIQILEAESGAIEFKTGVYFSYDAIANAVKLSDKYLHERFLPEKAMEIIKESAQYAFNKRGKNTVVNGEDVAHIISEKSKIPVSALTEIEKDKLLKLEEVIHERIIGQREAVDAVSRALRRARAGMHAGKRPIANFLFLGPTGVGKTELAKTIAQVYFGNEKAMVRLDMSEYQNKESVRRMIGGKGEEGYLTQAIRRTPFTLLLLDELEKAHPDILNLFLQVMEDGRLTDGRGRTIDFTNVILVATSNAGSSFIAKQIKAGAKVPKIKEQLVEEKLGEYFRPEFLNRLDGTIVFRPLEPQEIVQIAGLLIKKSAKKIEAKGIELVVEDKALRELAKLGFDPKFGARPLRRVIAREIEDRLANMLLSGNVKRRDKIVFHSLKDIEIVDGRKL